MLFIFTDECVIAMYIKRNKITCKYWRKKNVRKIKEQTGQLKITVVFSFSQTGKYNILKKEKGEKWHITRNKTEEKINPFLYSLQKCNIVKEIKRRESLNL